MELNEIFTERWSLDLEMTRSRNLIPLIARELKERLEKLQMRNVTEICVTMLMNDENDGQLTLW